jgi:thiamine biosynthesis protein ThiS
MPSTPGATGGSGADLEIRLNGEPYRAAPGSTLRDLVESAGCSPEAVAVEVNGEIVRRARLAETGIAGGDVIEIVRFVQGG